MRTTIAIRDKQLLNLDSLAILRPQEQWAGLFILTTLPLQEQQRARFEARDALKRWGPYEAEITVVNHYKYRLPAKFVLDTINQYRKTHGWKDESSVAANANEWWAIAQMIVERSNKRSGIVGIG